MRLRQWLAILVALIGYGSVSASGKEPENAASGTAHIEFDPAFLDMNGAPAGHVDLSLFEQRSYIPPGRYRADVTINNEPVGTYDINLVRQADANDQADTVPCVTRALLHDWGLDLQSSTLAQATAGSTSSCIELVRLLPNVRVEFDPDQQSLALRVSQAAMRRVPRGYIDPARWDHGDTLLMLNYSIDGRHSQSYRDHAANARSPMGLAWIRAGLNTGGWRLRSAFNAQTGNARALQFNGAYAQHDVAPIRGRITVGQASTSGEIFDSTDFTGVRIASDNAMLPDSQQSYAPTIQGIARTHATVTVRQRGFIIHQASVSPGPFVIDDLYGSATGDLEVTVTEADGSETRFGYPFTILPVFVRTGGLRYSAAFGAYRRTVTAPYSAKQHGQQVCRWI
ncbi:hypothetical protein DFQ28_009864 [Apophysomyces sp. BC1034]|nr:hypothetical protein DFQ30_011352 [Apophysomyces sp. BC1015]KAG0185155.1 hypothetical protein DFQ28_009864 [Apophysomyces sp. BC1034]